ncbi:hypothetical protein SeLEV6574_g04708 [Synchytrium endobioticum]|uniref:F-box domain-containing protein n=1 Tax=Synchytrium endobioticum TaxID=286115 RepID=A0A507CYE9_9FUNG|nr:hypothetical protein SeLEV6574_g04708 [Synchytrium endobioticum]
MILSPRVKPGVKFPERVVDIDGNQRNVRKLASRHELIVITLKDAWYGFRRGCGRKPSTSSEFEDPFGLSPHTVDDEERIYNGLLFNDVFFIVLSPGPHQDLVALRDDVGWEDDGRCLFVEDVGLEISQNLGILMIPPVGIWPGIMNVDSSLQVKGIELGRGPGHYGESALLKFLTNTRKWIEAVALDSAQKLEMQLSQTHLIPVIYDYPLKDKLPIEILEPILKQLDVRTRNLVSKVSMSWRTVVSSIYVRECHIVLTRLANYLPANSKGKLVPNGWRRSRPAMMHSYVSGDYLSSSCIRLCYWEPCGKYSHPSSRARVIDLY